MRFAYEHSLKVSETERRTYIDEIEADSFVEAGDIARSMFVDDIFISLLLLPAY